MADNVTLALKAYNDLRDENDALRSENEELTSALKEIEKKEGQKVIVREICTWEYEDGDECEERTTRVKGFEEVKAEVEDFYKKKFESLNDQIKELDDKNMELLDEIHKLRDEKLEAQMEASILKHRNLWQRILNK